MNALLAIILFALSSWAITALFLCFHRQRLSASWWAALVFFAGCGLGLGIWCTFFCEYHMGAELRIFSFPIPIAFFHSEHGRWVDFVPPEPLGWFMMLTNVLTVTALATLPLLLVCRRKRKYENQRLPA
jgi:hypothetical protein